MASGMMAAEAIELAVQKKDFRRKSLQQVVRLMKQKTTLLEAHGRTRKQSVYLERKGLRRLPKYRNKIAVALGDHMHNLSTVMGKERPSPAGIIYHGIIKDFLPPPIRWFVSPFVRKGRDADLTVDYGRGSDKGLDERLDSVIIQEDKHPHITVDTAACRECSNKQCTLSCPAGNYEWNEQDRAVVFNHEGCLECGTCRYICDSIQWAYPSHGNGVRFRYG